MANKQYVKTHVGLVEVVDHSTIQEKAASVNDIELVKQLYPQYNAQFFDSECLPGLSITERSLSKGTLAQVTSYTTFPNGIKKARTNPKNVRFEGMYFSSNYRFTEEQLRSLLLHEMIHVWLFAQGIIVTRPSGYHGDEFQTKRTEVESASGVPVPQSESANSFQLDDKILNKPYYGVYMYYQGRHTVAKFTDKLIKTELQSVVKWTEEMSQRLMAKKAWVFEVSNMNYMYQLPANRALNAPKMFLIKTEDLAELKEKATIIRQIK